MTTQASSVWVIWHGSPEGDNAIDKGGHPMFFQAPPGLLPPQLAQRLMGAAGNIILPGAEQAMINQAKVLFVWDTQAKAVAYAAEVKAQIDEVRALHPAMKIPDQEMPAVRIAEALMWDFVSNPPARVRPVAGIVRNYTLAQGGDLIPFDAGPQGDPMRGSR